MHVINDDGSNAVKLTFLEGSIGRSSWSPDGSKITYQSGGDIYVLNSDGTNIVMQTLSGRQTEPISHLTDPATPIPADGIST